jgi:hypothetical protein
MDRDMAGNSAGGTAPNQPESCACTPEALLYTSRLGSEAATRGGGGIGLARVAALPCKGVRRTRWGRLMERAGAGYFE